MKTIIKKTIASVITAVTLIAALSVICCATTYYSNQHWYVLTQKNTNGASVNLSEIKKEYGQVAVNTSNKSSVTVSLWQDLFLGFDDWCPEDQILYYGSNRRAWWFGNGNGNYFIYAQSNADNICLSGYLRNYYDEK